MRVKQLLFWSLYTEFGREVCNSFLGPTLKQSFDGAMITSMGWKFQQITTHCKRLLVVGFEHSWCGDDDWMPSLFLDIGNVKNSS